MKVMVETIAQQSKEAARTRLEAVSDLLRATGAQTELVPRFPRGG